MVVVGAYWYTLSFLTPLLPLFSLLLLLPLLLLIPLLSYPRGICEPVIQQALVVARGESQGGEVRAKVVMQYHGHHGNLVGCQREVGGGITLKQRGSGMDG